VLWQLLAARKSAHQRPLAFGNWQLDKGQIPRQKYTLLPMQAKKGLHGARAAVQPEVCCIHFRRGEAWQNKIGQKKK
jgi:hypothetical protein